MKYKIMVVTSSELTKESDALEFKVNKLMKEGWEPIGGVSISHKNDNEYICAQAMINREI